MSEFKIVTHDLFDCNEPQSAKDYWSSIAFESYVKEQPWSDFMAKKVQKFSPGRVFEFGCNAGKNLKSIL